MGVHCHHLITLLTFYEYLTRDQVNQINLDKSKVIDYTLSNPRYEN